jgi:superfamily II DNA or RNA helicase
MPSPVPLRKLATAPIVLATLALYGEPLSKSRLLDYLITAKITENGQAYTLESLNSTLKQLKDSGIVISASTGYSLHPDKVSKSDFQEILLNAIDSEYFKVLCETYEKYSTVQERWDGSLYTRTYSQALAGLRIALLSGQFYPTVHLWLTAALNHPFGQKSVHPFVEICAHPFNPLLFEQLHPDVQPEVMGFLLSTALDWADPATISSLRHWTENAVQRVSSDSGFPTLLALHWLLCGRLEEVSQLQTSSHLPIAITELLKGGESSSAVAAHFEYALKAFRKGNSIRSALFGGLAGFFYVLALLRSSDPKHRKQVETYLKQTQKQSLPELDSLLFERLDFLRQVQLGLVKAETVSTLNTKKDESGFFLQFFTCFLFYWLGSPKLDQKKDILLKLYQKADAAELYWITAQVAELLHRIGVKGQRYGERAQALREKYGFNNLADWFERQEPWQRQLSALMTLSSGVLGNSALNPAASRLVWLLSSNPQPSLLTLEPREQKQDARGYWKKGRAVALRRLCEGSEVIPSLTQQDQDVIASIRKIRSYYGTEYQVDAQKALVALIHHPLVFWQDAPDSRVELLPGAPELLIKKQDKELLISLTPRVYEDSTLLIQRETPTRLRIIEVTDQHRHMATILGKQLTVPIEAEKRVMEAIAAVAPLITVHSDIGGNADQIEQIEADGVLHALLLPNQQGLKMQLRVRPFGEMGAYSLPGQGAESVIAEIEGKPLQARRNLLAEANALKEVIAGCPTLEKADFAHEEWQLSEADDCLDLLLQLQAQNQVKVSWPEGEKFKLAAPRLDGSRFKMSIHGERDWFAVQGELQLDEEKVLDLQKLLTLVRQSSGRFIALGDNEFLALTEEFHRRLTELAAFSSVQGKEARIHSLASFALEDLAGNVTDLKTDILWKEHLKRLKQLDKRLSDVPGTLFADLRDYQVDGFQWLSRLAQWGVGACLADDMGLGKTVQLLALLLNRASSGPALVVAPTSVCTNWLSETARFAPSLNIILFGSGNREATLANLKPLDLVITSYGLLQQESERFKQVTWHTLVLDEAQAIKNSQTLRSEAVMALSSDFRVVATGTPLENHLGELWNLFRFINPGLLGSLKQFNERFAGPIERLQDATVRQRLRRLIQPFILRRTKTQVLSELPSRTEIVLKVELSKEESVLYEALRRSAMERLENLGNAPPGQRQIQILTEMMKLRRACCNPTLVSPELGLASSKLTAFGELVEELLENRHKALVFSQFVDHLTLIRQYLDEKGISYQYLDGATPMKERQRRVEAFQAGEGDLFLISLKAGGTGLNLTAADYVIHMDPWWNPAVEDQASDRAHRMGQKRPVTIYRLVAQQTIEEAIVSLHTHKRDLADSLLEGSDVSGRMSTQDMLTLLQEEFH